MADDKKNPKETSNIFHSIMKASVKPHKAVCPVSGSDAKLIDPKKPHNFICNKGHEFSEEA